MYIYIYIYILFSLHDTLVVYVDIGYERMSLVVRLAPLVPANGSRVRAAI